MFYIEYIFIIEPIAEGPVRTSSSMAPAMNPAIVKAVPASDE